MRLIRCKNYGEMSFRAANTVEGQILLKPHCVLGLPTGSTPVGMYENLVGMYERRELDFSAVTTFNLDEYYPILKNDGQSYYSFMREHLYSKVNLRPENIFIPDGATTNPAAECERYERAIAERGGIDLQVIGIGPNGHIGFNEPSEALQAKTHVTGLTAETIRANARFFPSADQVPQKAITMGISTILKSKKIVLLASGAKKREVVAQILEGVITTKNPATLLNVHPDVTLIVDEDAL